MGGDTSNWTAVERPNHKVMLIGTAGSGKSTFIKQLKIVHGEGFAEHERRRYAKIVQQVAAAAMRSVVRAMETLRVPYADPRSCAECAGAVDVDRAVFSARLARAIKTLWADPGVRRCYSRRAEYRLADSAGYYFEHVDRLAGPDYVPDAQDVLWLRRPTIGVLEYWFGVGQSSFAVIEPGDVNARKWPHCFDNLTSVVFVVAIDEYDRCDAHANLLEKSKMLFQFILQSTWVKPLSVILLLNKVDVFAEKIAYSRLKDHFPNYRGPPNDPTTAREFIKSMFMNVQSGDTIVYPYYTCTIDTKNVRCAFDTIKDVIIRTKLERSNE